MLFVFVFLLLLFSHQLISHHFCPPRCFVASKKEKQKLVGILPVLLPTFTHRHAHTTNRTPYHTMPKIPSMKGSGIESNRCLQATVKCTVRSPSLPACVLAVILVATFTCFVIRPLWIRNELLVFGQERMVAEHLSTLWGNTKAKHDEDAFLSKREALRQQVQNNGDKHAWVTSVASGTANLLFFKETTASRPCDALVPCLLDEQKAWFWVALYQGSSHHLLNWPVLSDATPYASVG